MTIEQLRRLKHLAEMPTHSPASLEELKKLVKMATIRTILFYDERNLCNYCANRKSCRKKYPDMNYCEIGQNFQLEMEDA